MRTNNEINEEFKFDCATEDDITAREKALLWPILKALKIDKRKWEMFKIHPDQLTGLAISCIKEQDRLITDLGKKIRGLQLEYAKVCQLNMDFRRCPLDPREKT